MNSWFAVRKPLSKTRSAGLAILSFILPLLIWSAFSYFEFLWHPYMEVTNVGDSNVEGDYDYITQGMLVEKKVFQERNKTLLAAGAPSVQGIARNPIYFPAPHEVFKAFYYAFKTEPQRTGDQWLHSSLLHSFRIIFLGFFWSAIFGIPVGILCGTFSFFSKLIEPFVDFVRYMPAPVFGALAVSILGLDDGPKITIIFIGTFFQMVLVVATTTSKLDASLLEAGQTLGARNKDLVLKVVIPGILPNLYRDIRILIGWAWTYLVVAELVGAKSGISAFLYQSQRYKQFDNVYASILMIGIVGLITDQVLAFFGRRLFPWESGKPALFSRSIKAIRKFADPATVWVK